MTANIYFWHQRVAKKGEKVKLLLSFVKWTPNIPLVNELLSKVYHWIQTSLMAKFLLSFVEGKNFAPFFLLPHGSNTFDTI